MLGKIFGKMKKTVDGESSKGEVVVRIPPSPTGYLHIGTARTALFNYLFAKKHGGKIVLRMEDTDQERSEKIYENSILEGLEWLGIDYQEMYRQSERTEVYKKYLEKMVRTGHAYVSEEENGERDSVIRFKNPNRVVTFEDEIRGEITFDTTELGDFVIAKSMEEPLYHIAVVVDDHEMGVTHVIRGEDGISNTPRQILLQEAIGAKTPVYAHLPLILAPDKTKLSKRHGAVSLMEYKEQGFLPEAILNYLALLGWNPGDDQEFFSRDELIKTFDLKKVQKGGAVFNIDKLKWFNKHYIVELPEEIILEKIKKAAAEKYGEETAEIEQKVQKILPIIHEKIETLNEVNEIIGEGEFDYVFAPADFDLEKIVWKEETLENTKKYLEEVLSRLEKVSPSEFNREGVKAAIWDFAEEKGKGNILWPLRFLLTGKEKSPDPFQVSEILGKEEVTTRIKNTIEKIENA